MVVVAEPVEKVVDFPVVIMLLPDLQVVDLPVQELIMGLAQLGLRELPVGMEIMEQTELLVTMVQQVQTDPQVPILVHSLFLAGKQELEQMEQVDKVVPAVAEVEDKMVLLLMQDPDMAVPVVAEAVKEQ
jgi:hypothetical protein